MRKALTLILSLLFLVNIAYGAEFSAKEGYDWLLSKSVNGSVENDVSATAWTALAFDGVQWDMEAEDALNWIFSQQSDNYCFPNSMCLVEDTAMALIAMNNLQRLDNATEIANNLKESMRASSVDGKWAIEVSPLTTSIGSGECTISWQTGDNVEEKTVRYDQGKFPDCQNSFLLDIEHCVKPGLLTRYPGISIRVDCSNIEGDKVISLVYLKDATYHLLESVEGSTAEITVNNGCFGLGQADTSCRIVPTLYANWALNEAGENINNRIYLMDKYDENDAEQNALLAIITKDKEYLDKLKSLQIIDGSFGRSVATTALAVLALKQDETSYSDSITLATDWLKRKQKEDGSLGNAKDTAMALYAAFTGKAINAPPSEIPSEPMPNDELCNYDGVCDSYLGEDEVTCPDDCPEPEIQRTDICDENGICDVEYDENSLNCQDCYCGDDICDDAEDEDGCPEDCGQDEVSSDEQIDSEDLCNYDGICDPDAGEDDVNCPTDCVSEGGSSLGLIIGIILVLSVVIGGYIAFKKGLFKPKKPVSPYAKPGYKFQPKGPIIPSSLQKKPAASKPLTRSFGTMKSSGKKNDELAKSIEEAKKLLGK